jgi:hypothetical protein
MGEFGGDIEDFDSVGGQLLRQGCAEPASSFDRSDRLWPALGESAQLSIPGAVDLDAQ